VSVALAAPSMRCRLIAAACAAVAAFAATRPAVAEPAAAPATAPAAKVDASKFLRFAEASDGVGKQLQTSIVRFKNDAGVEVDLIGAVHIADRSYYEALNKHFKDYDVVLYEMVKPKDMAGVNVKGRSPSFVGMLQRFMQEQLDLSYQLDCVDYQAKNFVHADLTAEAFAERQAERGESMLSIMLNSMMREMNKAQDDAKANANANAGGEHEMGIMDLIEALQSPDRSRQLKLVLAHQFANMDDGMSALGDDSVILGERNTHALEVLKQQIDAGKKHLAVFYGAAHLKGMEETMTGLMGFKQVGEPQWLVAWDLADKSKLPAPPMPAIVEPGKPTPPATQPAH
jgi:uncharacterized protein YjgD (DUF1641 family)